MKGGFIVTMKSKLFKINDLERRVITDFDSIKKIAN